MIRRHSHRHHVLGDELRELFTDEAMNKIVEYSVVSHFHLMCARAGGSSRCPQA
jgi:hypothetical protein